jgi:DNA-binding GntR family transcriptional regulator
MLRTPELQRHPRLRDQVYDALRELLRSGEFPEAGIVENELAAHLNVSRTPVREALFQLCREGMLEDTGRGYRVPELSEIDMREIVEMRMMIEPQVVALAVERADPAALAALEAELAIEASSHEAGDVAAFASANGRFRAQLLASCSNSRISQILGVIDDQLQRLRLRTLVLAENRLVTLRGHEAILVALRRRDSRAAARSMRNILSAAARFYEKLASAEPS